MKVYTEHFENYGQLRETLRKRPNNSIMHENKDSQSDDEEFTGSKSYEEAEKLMLLGYTEVIPKIKSSIKQQKEIQSKYAAMIEHPKPHNARAGFVPNVPNAILGIPESMVSIDRKPMKRKTLSIIYGMGANCGTEASEFIKAGTTLLTAIDIIEKSGIQTKLEVGFFPGVSGKEAVFPTMVIKNYGERYAIQKISFPIAHPSMFRRMGFKWLETNPYIKEKGWHCGYGREPNKEEYKEIEQSIGKKHEDYLISFLDIRKEGYSVEWILKKCEVLK